MATKRIDELPPHTLLHADDRFAVWSQVGDATRYVSLASIASFIGTGGNGATTPPVYDGGSMIYVVPASEHGGQTASIPAAAGKSFRLRRSGTPLFVRDPANPQAYDEIELLSAGGFKLVQSGDQLNEGERFELEFYTLIAAPPGPGTPPAGGGNLFSDTVEITASTTINQTNHYGKLLQLRGTSGALTLTLPDVTNFPLHAVVPIEASINNTKQHTIATTGGQFIYLRNDGKVSVYMAPGEVLWLLCAADGWYVINDFGRCYGELGKISQAYKAGLGELVCKGQLVLRSDYPRLWEYVQGLASAGSLVDDATWNRALAFYYSGAWHDTLPGGTTAEKTVERPYRGCFSTGTVTSGAGANFRLPDLMDMFLRGLKSETGSDPERYLNRSGGAQQDENKSHNHTGPQVPLRTGDNDRGGNSSLFSLDNAVAGDTGYSGGAESRPKNIGILHVIKY